MLGRLQAGLVVVQFHLVKARPPEQGIAARQHRAARAQAPGKAAPAQVARQIQCRRIGKMA